MHELLPGFSTNIASVPAYGTNNIAYGAHAPQSMASLANTNNILTQARIQDQGEVNMRY